MKTIIWFLLVIAAGFAAIAFVPLKIAVDLLQLRRFGLEAAQIEGNIWSGQLFDAHLGKIALGDVTSKLSLADLTKGRLRLDIAGSDEVSRLKGVFSYGLGGAGIDDFNIGMPVMAGPPPIGGVTLIVEGLKAHFPGGDCADGSGEVRAYLSGALPAIGLPGEMSGPALCRDGKLTFDLASPSGREQELITILAANRYKVRAFIRPTSPQIGQFLQSKGFVPVDDGYAYEEERTL